MKNYLYMGMIIITITTMSAYTMENAISLAIMSKKSPSEATLHNYKLLKQFEDMFYKTFSLSNINTQNILRNTCKHFYTLFLPENLSNLIAHGFDIDKEQTTFFKSIIRTNKPELIPIIVNQAHKKINEKKDNIIIELSDVTQEDKKIKEKILVSYKTPLLKEAIHQRNEIMIRALAQDNFDTTLLTEYRTEQSSIRKDRICRICCWTVITMISIGSLIGIGFGIANNPCVYNHTLHCMDK